MPSNKNSWVGPALRFLGYYQLCGGALGIVLVVQSVVAGWPATVAVLGIWGVFLALSAFSVFCGVRCLQAKSNSLTLSKINQIFQVIGLALYGFSYHYAAGIYLSVGLKFPEFLITLGAGLTRFDISLATASRNFAIELNLAALGLIYLVEKLRSAQQKNTMK